jgi:pyruvate dehydrogenase E2 component (dihydrolipoamide acetyltransferase)
MAVKVKMPLLSDTMESGKILKWLKNEGDKVESGDAIAEVESDKADMEIPAYSSGTMRKHFFQEGESAKVGALIAIIGEPDEDISSLVSEQPQPATGGHDAAPAENKSVGQPAPEKKSEAPSTDEYKPAEQQQPKQQGEQPAAAQTKPSEKLPEKPVTDQKAQPSTNGRVKASPLARKVASETGVELSGVSGTGPGGRIVRRDVEAAGTAAKQVAKPAAQDPTQKRERGEGDSTVKPLSSMRRTIAKRLVQSIGPIPTFYLTIEVDMARIVEMREQIHKVDENLKVSINDFVIKAVAASLLQHPNINASFDGDSISEHHHIDIGMAVAIEDGLITPIIRDADTKSLGQIGREAKELAAKARDRKLQPDEFIGATFSISNLGMLGIEEFTAIINPPESAILAVGGLVEKAVVVDGQLTVGKRMRMTMSCDHRVIDGATGAKFLATLKKILENPVFLIV